MPVPLSPIRRMLLALPLLSLFTITYFLLYFSYNTSPLESSSFTPDSGPNHPHFPNSFIPEITPAITSTSTSSSSLTPAPQNPHTPTIQCPAQQFDILTFITHETTYDHISHSNKALYSSKHGYNLHIDYNAGSEDVLAQHNPVWHKISMLEGFVDRKIREEKAKQEEQKKGACMCGPAPEIWIWWLDWDTIITNTTVKLENLVKEAKGRWERGVLQPDDDEDDEKDEGKEQNKNEKPKSDGVSRKDGKEGAETEEKEVGQKKQYDKKEEEGVIIDDILVGKDLKKEADQTAAAEEKEELDMIITADCKPINAGSILLRPSPRILAFLRQVRECGLKSLNASQSSSSLSTSVKNEQDCIQEILFSNADGIRNRTVVLPQTRMNSYPHEITSISQCYDSEERSWRRGDFLVHFAGAWAHLKTKEEKEMEKLKEKVKMKEKNGEGKVAAIKSVIAEMEDMAGGVVGEMLDMMGKVGLWKGLINHHGTKNKGDLAVENLIEKVEMDRYGPLLRKYAKLVDVGPDEDDDEEDVEKAGDVRNAVVHKGVVTEDEDDEDGDDDTDTDAAEEAEEDLGVDIS